MDHLPSEDEGREKIIRALADVLQFIHGTPFLGGHWPLPRQALALGLHQRRMPGADPNAPLQLLFGGSAGGGKALSVDTPVPTPDGFVPMGELRRGSAVFGADGKPTRVLAVSVVIG